MKKPEKSNPTHQRKPKKEKDYSAIKYGLATAGLIAIITILATLPKKRPEQKETPKTVKTTEKAVKKWKKNDYL